MFDEGLLSKIQKNYNSILKKKKTLDLKMGRRPEYEFSKEDM